MLAPKHQPPLVPGTAASVALESPNPAADAGPFLTRKEARYFLRCQGVEVSRTTLWRLEQRGELRFVRGLIRQAVVRAWMEGNPI